MARSILIRIQYMCLKNSSLRFGGWRYSSCIRIVVPRSQRAKVCVFKQSPSEDIGTGICTGGYRYHSVVGS